MGLTSLHLTNYHIATCHRVMNAIHVHHLINADIVCALKRISSIFLNLPHGISATSLLSTDRFFFTNHINFHNGFYTIVVIKRWIAIQEAWLFRSIWYV